MSWFPGTATTGAPRPRRKAAARSCWAGRPRFVRSPVATISSGCACATNAPIAWWNAGSSRAPKWRSEKCRMRVITGEAGYTVSEMADEPTTEVFDDLYLGLPAGAALPGGWEPGAAEATPAGELPARYVIHTVGPVWGGGDAGEPELLASCHRRSLDVARELGARTVAFPAISCGIYGYPAELAAVV